jgi:hypothetical protein
MIHIIKLNIYWNFSILRGVYRGRGSNPLKCMVGMGMYFDCVINWNLRMEIFFNLPP